MSLTRSQVDEILRGERAYQKHRWSRGDEEVQHSTGNWCRLMRYYLNEANEAFAVEPVNTPALAELRKVVALALAAAEHRGATLHGICDTVADSEGWDLGEFICRIERTLTAVEGIAIGIFSGNPVEMFKSIIRDGIACFKKLGCPPRAFDPATVVNARSNV
jgi:hypothetical protein